MSKLTPEALEALQQSDPAAFDMDETPVQAAAETVDESAEAKEARERDESGRFKAKADKEDTPPAEVEAKSDETAQVEQTEKTEDDKPKVNMVPQPRVDELAAERNREREGRLAAERRVAELEAAQAAANNKDYDAEIAALDAKYDDGDIAFADFQKARDALVAEKTRAEVLADVAKKDAERVQQTVQQQYDAARARFFESDEHRALVGTRSRDAAFAAALDEVFESGTAKTYDEVFVLAADIVRKDFPTAAAKAEEKPANPQAPRNAADAAAASRASNAPPSISGGVGNRANVAGTIDLSRMKPGKFSSLPKEQQEALLGEGAL